MREAGYFLSREASEVIIEQTRHARIYGLIINDSAQRGRDAIRARYRDIHHGGDIIENEPFEIGPFLEVFLQRVGQVVIWLAGSRLVERPRNTQKLVRRKRETPHWLNTRVDHGLDTKVTMIMDS